MLTRLKTCPRDFLTLKQEIRLSHDSRGAHAVNYAMTVFCPDMLISAVPSPGLPIWIRCSRRRHRASPKTLHLQKTNAESLRRRSETAESIDSRSFLL